MHSVNLIARSIKPEDPDRPVIPGNAILGICAITGEECITVPRAELISSSFTDGGLLQSPNSDRVGIDPYLALKYKWERMSSWICEGETFRRLLREDVRDIVLGNRYPPDIWAGYVTTSYKKHGSLRTPVNHGGSKIWLFESRVVDCTDYQKVSDWWLKLHAIFCAGVGRTILRTLECPPIIIRKICMKWWVDFEEWARPRYQSPLYDFLVYLLPKLDKKEEKSEGN